MNKITPLVVIVIWFSCRAQAGFLPSQVAYNAGFSSHIPFAGEQNYATPYGLSYGATYATPLPVAPISGPHPYAAVSYSTPPVFRFRSISRASYNPYTSYASVRSHHKFALPAAVPTFYNAPAPVAYGPPPVAYSGFPAPNAVIKFGPPITTTTTTYSTTAAASVPVTNSLNAVAGW